VTSSTRVILVTGSSLVGVEVLDLIASRGFTTRRLRKDAITDAELHDALRGASGYLLGGYEEPKAEHFERAAPVLETVAFVGTDYQALIPGWQRALELGIALSNAPGANAQSVAEFTMLLILSLARPLFGTIARPGDGDAALGEMGPVGLEVRGRTLGIIGTGRIAHQVARMAASGLGMEVLYTGRRRNEDLERTAAASFVDKAALLERADVVSLHRAGPAEGEGPELTAADLSRLRHGAFLVNTAHPDLIDVDALLNVIRLNGVRAASDGLRLTPAWRRLIALGPDRFLCLPQQGFLTAEANLRAALLGAESVCDVLDGGNSALVVNPWFRQTRSGLPGYGALPSST